MIRRFAVLAVLLSLSACGGSKSPTTPTPPAIAQVGGLWGWTGTQTSVSGGECVGQAFAAGNGITRITGSLAINQTGGSLTATSTADSTGERCDYTGTAGSNNIVLNGTSCSLGTMLGFPCSNGALRDFQIQTLGVNATVSGNSFTGTSVATYNVVVSGTSTGVGLMTVNAAYTATRR